MSLRRPYTGRATTRKNTPAIKQRMEQSVPMIIFPIVPPTRNPHVIITSKIDPKQKISGDNTNFVRVVIPNTKARLFVKNELS